VEGAIWKDDHLVINDGASVPLARSQIRWVHIDDKTSSEDNRVQVNLPVYLNNDRNDDLLTVSLSFAGTDAPLSVVRAVCLTAGGNPSN
jgi:dynein heavy chain 1